MKPVCEIGIRLRILIYLHVSISLFTDMTANRIHSCGCTIDNDYKPYTVYPQHIWVHQSDILSYLPDFDELSRVADKRQNSIEVSLFARIVVEHLHKCLEQDRKVFLAARGDKITVNHTRLVYELRPALLDVKGTLGYRRSRSAAHRTRST